MFKSIREEKKDLGFVFTSFYGNPVSPKESSEGELAWTDGRVIQSPPRLPVSQGKNGEMEGKAFTGTRVHYAIRGRGLGPISYSHTYMLNAKWL